MNSLLLSPHDDDSALFAAFTCQREHPLIVVCLDSWIQPLRGEVGCSAAERARETIGAHAFFKCDTQRLGLRDDQATKGLIRSALLEMNPEQFDVVYAPADQEGGNVHHTMVARAAVQVFGNRVKAYTTYTSKELYTTGNVEIVPTERELTIKNRALESYESQLRINKPHFDAVAGRSEWFI